MKNNRCKKGFTLIELLVVVLIIGILAAIALPQYQKAVWKSRAAELITHTRNVYNAQQVYFTEQGHFADNFDLLPIDFKGMTRMTEYAQSMGARDGYIKGNGEMFVWLVEGTGGTSGAVFGTGPYAMSGFAVKNQGGNHCQGVLAEGQLLCVEMSSQKTGFCEKLFKGTDMHATCGNGYYYKLP